MIKIAPSILNCDFSRLNDILYELQTLNVDMLHIDIMDGNFVPQLTFGADIVKFIRNETDLFLDLHLMVNFPNRLIKSFAEAGANSITVHYESKDNIKDALKMIKGLNKLAGIAINPHTSEQVLANYLELVDFVLIMTVEPGFGGQKFNDGLENKISKVNSMILNSGKEIKLQVDGGINERTGVLAVQNGAKILVSGSWLFSGNLSLNIEKLKQLG